MTVSTKLKLHGQAGSHAKSKIDTEELTPEARHIAVDCFAGDHVNGFHNSQQKNQPRVRGTNKK